MNDWWEAFWFFLPAGFANMAPVLAAKIPGLSSWNTPVDFSKSWRGIRIFGDHKTWRGIVSGTLFAAFIGWIQYRFIGSSPEPTWFILLATATMGFGALLGDAVKSFAKRRRKIPSGNAWIPFDQLDYIIGGILAVSIFIQPSAEEVLRIFIIYFGLHLVVSYLGYLAGFKKKPI